MSQATWPASAMILRSFMGAISPFFCSSKSLLSANGSAAFACLSTSKVNFDGALPLILEMALQGVDLSGARRANIQDQMIG